MDEIGYSIDWASHETTEYLLHCSENCSKAIRNFSSYSGSTLIGCLHKCAWCRPRSLNSKTITKYNILIGAAFTAFVSKLNALYSGTFYIAGTAGQDQYPVLIGVYFAFSAYHSWVSRKYNLRQIWIHITK